MAPPSASMCLGNLTFSGEICFSRYTLSNGILDAGHLPLVVVPLEILDLFVPRYTVDLRLKFNVLYLVE